MITPVSTLFVAVVPRVAAWLVVLCWPRTDSMAPAVSTETVKSGTRRPRRIITYVHSRFSPESATSVA